MSGEVKRVRRTTDPFSQVFEHLYVLEGGSTLIFTIDTTGSMSNEIAEAKNIATDIINMPRLDGVDYILSPFNDPCKFNFRYITSLEI